MHYAFMGDDGLAAARLRLVGHRFPPRRKNKIQDTIHYNTLYDTLRYTTLHYTTLCYTTQHYMCYNTILYTTIHYILTIQITTMQYNTRHYTSIDEGPDPTPQTPDKWGGCLDPSSFRMQHDSIRVITSDGFQTGTT